MMQVVGMDCEDGIERNRVVQQVDLQMDPCSSKGKTGETELKQRLHGSCKGLAKSRTWLGSRGRSLDLKLAELAGFSLGR